MKDFLEFLGLLGEMALTFFAGIILLAVVVFVALGLTVFSISIPFGAGLLIGKLMLMIV